MYLSHADFSSDTEVINPFPIFPKIPTVSLAMWGQSQIKSILCCHLILLSPPAKKEKFIDTNEALYILEWNLSTSEAEDVKFLQNFHSSARNSIPDHGIIYFTSLGC